MSQARSEIGERRGTRIDRSDFYRGIDFRDHPEQYRIGRGEEGVLTAEPYKAELLPLWRFRTPDIARTSAAALWRAFERYRAAEDFVGLDMARKFLQMGYTRARRYANHPSGRKYAADGSEIPRGLDAVKAAAAEIFLVMWRRAEADPAYAAWKKGQISMASAKKKAATKSAKKTATKTAKKAAKKAAPKKNSLVANINRRKRAGKSRPKSKSTIAKASYDEMEAGWPKAKRATSAKKATRKTAKKKTRAA